MKFNLKHFFLILTTFSVLSAYAGPLDDFVTTWKTDNPGTSNNTSITIPTFSGETYNYDVDWNNDGIFDQFGITGNVTHNFGIAGTYTIRIQGTFPRIYFNNSFDKDKILSVDQWGNQVWTSMEKAFYGCSNLNGLINDIPDLSNVDNMSYMFQKAYEFNQDINAWNTSHVTDMRYLFYEASNFNKSIDSWNTSNVTTMVGMFAYANLFDQDINSWNTGNVTDMESMFAHAYSFNGNISSWNTFNVTNMFSMFKESMSFNCDISGWNTTNVTNMSQMFSKSSFNHKINAWNVGKVIDMSSMFYNSNFNNDLNSWNTSNVLYMTGMFFDSSFNGNIDSWNTSNVVDMSSMFRGAYYFNQNIGNWNISNVTNIHSMFYDAISFNQDIGNWDIENITDLSNLFKGAESFNKDIGSWNTINVNKMNYMFDGALQFNQDIGNWNISNLTQVYFMFSGNSLSIENYDALLTGWQNQPHNNNILFYSGNNQYCLGEHARNSLINNNGWLIFDGGSASNLTDTLSTIYACDSFTLPVLGFGNYYTQPSAGGNMIFSGDNIYSSTTLYIYFNNGNCISENTIEILFSPILDTVYSNSCNYIDTGKMTETLTNIYGCDSIVTIITSLLPSYSKILNDTICFNDFYILSNGDSVNTTGTYIDTFSTINNCDSIVTLNLKVNGLLLNISQFENTLITDNYNATYQWLNCETNQVIEGAINQNFSPTENGVYSVIVTQNNCSISSECVEYISTSLIEQKKTELKIYPNPTIDKLNIKYTESIYSKIYNFLGEEVHCSNQKSINIKNFSSGVYYIQIFNLNNELIDIKKFIKIK